MHLKMTAYSDRHSAVDFSTTQCSGAASKLDCDVFRMLML